MSRDAGRMFACRLVGLTAVAIVRLAVLTGASACGGGGQDSSDDAVDGIPPDPGDSPLLDIAPADGAIPCDDQNVSRLLVGGDLGPASQRYVEAAAVDGDEIVIAWTGRAADWTTTMHVGRIRDPFAPAIERLPEPTPLPAISVLLPLASGVRVIFTDAPGGAPLAWADLGHDNALGPTTEFGAPPAGVRFLSAGRACAADSGSPMAVFAALGADDSQGLVVAVLDGPAPRYLSPVFPTISLGAGDVLLPRQCFAAGGTVTVVAESNGAAPRIVQWSVADGLPLRPSIPVGDSPASTVTALYGSGIIVFAVAGSTTGIDAPIARAFRLAGDVAYAVTSEALDPLPGSGWSPVPLAVFPTPTELLVLYKYSGILFLLPYSDAAGFGRAAILTDAGCDGRPDVVATTPEGTFLACAGAGPGHLGEEGLLYIVGMCRSRGGS